MAMPRGCGGIPPDHAQLHLSLTPVIARRYVRFPRSPLGFQRRNGPDPDCRGRIRPPAHHSGTAAPPRSEEHTSELQSLTRISNAVFCSKKIIHTRYITNNIYFVPQ